MFFSFQILNVKTQLKPDSTAFYRNTQPSVTLGSEVGQGLGTERLCLTKAKRSCYQEVNVNSKESVKQSNRLLYRTRGQYKPQPRRLLAMMMSVTASNTTWILFVSVAQVM